METFVKILVGYGIYCLILVIIAMYLVIRSFKVSSFRSRIFDLTNKSHRTDIYSANRALIRSIEKKIIGGPSYSRMVFSFKPLRLKYWFSDEEVSLIKTLEQKLKDENEIKTNQT